MLLCIDIGNTNTVLATFDGDKLVHNWRIKTDAASTADELGLMFRGLLAGDAVEITGVAACSTVPAKQWKIPRRCSSCSFNKTS